MVVSFVFQAFLQHFQFIRVFHKNRRNARPHVRSTVSLSESVVNQSFTMTETQSNNFSPTDVNKVKSSVKNACEYLGEVRKIKKHEPLIVVSVGQMLIEKYYSKLREDDSMTSLLPSFFQFLFARVGHFGASLRRLFGNGPLRTLQGIYSILFDSIRFDSILFYPILSYPILSYPILSYPILSYPILS
jgi:hypothetical protein